MAAFDTTRPSAGLTSGRISSLFVSAFATVAAWNDTRITRNSLSKLTARELQDIGLTVADIEGIATRNTR